MLEGNVVKFKVIVVFLFVRGISLGFEGFSFICLLGRKFGQGLEEVILWNGEDGEKEERRWFQWGVYLVGVMRLFLGSRYIGEIDRIWFLGSWDLQELFGLEEGEQQGLVWNYQRKNDFFYINEIYFLWKIEFFCFLVINCVCVWFFFNEYILVIKIIYFLFDVVFFI